MRKTKMAVNHKMEKLKKHLIKDLNVFLTCNLCGGYLIDATALTDCLHSFCRGCILRHFETNKSCPSCNTLYKKKKKEECLLADLQLQALVYKLVPGLYSKEMQRREDFYRSTGVRASSSCSDDSVLERERDMIDKDMAPNCGGVGGGERAQYFGPDDYISLSLEYYQALLDDTPMDGGAPRPNREKTTKMNQVNGTLRKSTTTTTTTTTTMPIITTSEKCDSNQIAGKRYLQCPAAVSMKHLQKFIRMKYALTAEHRVDIIYEGEVLPTRFSLMDVAYTFEWDEEEPLRFFYRIFTPMKVQPIKIVNTSLNSGEKQLQIVSIKPTTDVIKKDVGTKMDNKECVRDEAEKERLLANLQLQSKSKVQSPVVPEKPAKTAQDCVFEYEEPDKEEIKRFAEIRDREWALQKKLDEEYHHFSKKRKKNKHSKNEVYKKRKLHAEITNKEEDLKLKVKLTHNNGHKHKHHKGGGGGERNVELSSKEKLLQMRQVRHKHQLTSEDKNVQTQIPSGSGDDKLQIEEIKPPPPPPRPPRPPQPRQSVPPPPSQARNEEIEKLLEPLKKEVKLLPPPPPPPSTPPSSSSSSCENMNEKKSGFGKEWGNRVPTVQIERNEQTEEQAKKTFLKTFQSYAEKYHKAVDKPKVPSPSSARPCSLLDRNIANLQQRCTVEKKPSQAAIKIDKPPHQYPPGFTVSKIEQGTKRKIEITEDGKDKRPSLEITLINPPIASPPKLEQQQQPPPKTTATTATAKRPPPPTIPLDRIKKSLNFKSGISIIPKTAEKCDNIGALDLSKPNKAQQPKTTSTTTTTTTTTTNGYAETKNVQLSNLQMLSKVATDLNNKMPPKQLPQLQTLKIPNLNPMNTTMVKSSSSSSSSNLAKLPKLTEINKTQFRLMNPQIRNLRPNQNQNIRNIPNPSLLVRQQNQNRLNSIHLVGNGEKKKDTSSSSSNSSSKDRGEGEKKDERTVAMVATSILPTQSQ